MYRYIALLKRLDPQANQRLDQALRNLGLHLAASTDGVTLYASAQTPVVVLPCGGILVGHLFSQDAHTVVDGIAVSRALREERSGHRFTERFWGEYLVIHSPGSEPAATSVRRDPSGGVDCAYSLRHGFISSDISIATRVGLFERQVDWDFIRANLRYPHLKTGRTGLMGLRELLPGHRLHLRRGANSLEQDWNPWEFVAPKYRHRDQREAQAEVRQAVTDSVTRWAETDDSVLVELSGGLDSSIVAACLRGAEAKIACMNLVTPVPGADERQYARLMADLLGVELHFQTLGFETPYFDSPPPPHTIAPSTWFLQHAANALTEAVGERLGVASFFSGGGGDTVFGYTRTAAPAADAFRECGGAAGIRAVHDLAELHQCTFWKAAGLTLKKLLARAKPPRKPDGSFLPPTATNNQDMSDSHPWFAAPNGALPGDRERVFDLVGTQVFRDGLARSTRGHLRMPLLSQPVVEACLKVPSWMWIAGGRNRAVARDAFADLLPADVLHRRSKGTFMGYSGAVFRKNRHQLRDYLLTGELQSRSLLDTDALVALFDGNEAAHGDAFMRIFDLCAIESWVRHQA